jgi:hypothetical protein
MRWRAAWALPFVVACSPARPEANAPLPDDLRISPLARDGGPLVDPDEQTHPATREECVAIVDVNIEVQLKEMGFNDPALLEARKKELHVQLASEIEKCIGRKTSTKAIDCAMSAKSAGQIDRCFH